MSGPSGVWARLANDEALLEAAANDVLNNLIDEAIRGQAFEIHRAVKTGMYLITDPDLAQNEDSNDSIQSVESSTNLSGGGGGGSGTTTPPVGIGVPSQQPGMVDVFGQAVTTTSGVPPLKKQCECVCPNCQRNLAATRFAPHLEKCMGMGRNSSRIASRRLANSANKDKDHDHDGGEDEDEDWIEPSKAVGNRRKRDKNSPRRNRGGGNSSRVTSSTSSATSYSNENSMDTHSGVQTPPLGYENMTPEERNHMLGTVCGVISNNSRKICMRTTKCPFHNEGQRRDIRLKWLSTSTDNDETVDIDSFTEGDTATLRESLAQLSNASSPAESTISTSSNPSANSSLRGHSSRREGKGSGGRSGRGGKKGKPGSKGGSRGSTPPLTLLD